MKNWLNILVAASQVMQPFWENTFPANNRAVKGIKTPKETGSEMAGGDGKEKTAGGAAEGSYSIMGININYYQNLIICLHF